MLQLLALHLEIVNSAEFSMLNCCTIAIARTYRNMVNFKGGRGGDDEIKSGVPCIVRTLHAIIINEELFYPYEVNQKKKKILL